MLYINTYNQSRLSCWEVSLHVWAVRLWRWEATAAESCDRSLVSLNQINEDCDLGLSGILDNIDNHLPQRRTFSHRIQANWIAWIQDQKSQIEAQGSWATFHQPASAKAILSSQAAFPVDPSEARSPEFSSRPPHLRKVQYRIHIGYSTSCSDCKHCE